MLRHLQSWQETQHKRSPSFVLFCFIVANLTRSATRASNLRCISNTDLVKLPTLETSDIYDEQLTLLSMQWFTCCYVMQLLLDISMYIDMLEVP